MIFCLNQSEINEMNKLWIIQKKTLLFFRMYIEIAQYVPF